MKTTIETIISSYMVRRTKRQKAAFCTYLTDQLAEKGYTVQDETQPYLMKNHNLIIGDVKTAEALVCAHYDTPAAMPFANHIWPASRVRSIGLAVLIGLIAFWAGWILMFILRGTIPLSLQPLVPVIFLLLVALILGAFCAFPNKNNYNDNTSGVVALLNVLDELGTKRIAYVLFDNEEWGMLGSRGFLKAYGEDMQKKLLFNLDCVGEGDHILFMLPSSLYQSPQKDTLEACMAKAANEQKKLYAIDLQQAFYPSDQKGFAQGIAVCSCGVMGEDAQPSEETEEKKAKKEPKLSSLHIGKIHTNEDRCLDFATIEAVKMTLVTFLG